MKISTIIITFGMFPDKSYLVEEAIESWKRQTYQNKDLLVLNDCQEQTLVLRDEPGITMVNVPRRFHSLGEKYNAAFAMTDGEIVCYLDHDDLWLPRHLEQSIARLGSHAYYNPRHSFFQCAEVMAKNHSHGYCLNHSIYRREAFNSVGGFDHISGPGDAKLDGKLRTLGDTVDDMELKPDQWQAVYRWGVSPMHLSGAGDPKGAYKAWGERKFESGMFTVRPHWRVDYGRLCSKLAAAKDGAIPIPYPPKLMAIPK